MKTATRSEVLKFVRPVFGAGSVDRGLLLEGAKKRRAPVRVLTLLDRLPARRRFTQPQQLWEELPEVPIGQ